ncbi:hypothetical protein JAAARDRAFT_29013 [Jaapia argillacea MUCL 33604]|uniref:FAD dependent oxidoreductase domain-containing protein n=1 Tax=Jaapia argillacea MUCL 33604 TaxID=933084 RepID=A0A067Q7T9_9AGAM|nr:hypothetical protein JAAARDRAFT_29013 [Jaapia argillacea MUCL 33604]
MTANTKQREVIIVGAGVIGLSIAHVLTSDPSASYKITVVARDLPDQHMDSQAWASPWAGANWSPIGDREDRRYKWEAETFKRLWDMIPTGLTMALPTKAFYGDEVSPESIWYQDIPRDFHFLPKDDLPPNMKTGVAFTTVSLAPQAYLPWLQSELKSKGVNFICKKIDSLEDALVFGGSGCILINATGLGARSLLGVEDLEMFPIRGQTILVHAPNLRESLEIASDLHPQTSTGDATYIIPRPGNTVLLGGTFQQGNWDVSLSMSTAGRILSQSCALAPVLKSPDTRILAHNVGLRPARRGGARVEVEWVEFPLKGELNIRREAEVKAEIRKVMVIHAYGFGPAGYQCSWGVAEEVQQMLRAGMGAKS